MFSSITIEHIKEILTRVSKGEQVSFNERLYIQKAADQDQKVNSWLTKATRIQFGKKNPDAVDELLHNLDLGTSEPISMQKPDPDELGSWFSGAPSWVARS
ncbi:MULTISPECIES: hypothetical protein [Prochlorococcus]|uniref:Uncharacterized protein n=1 Tax=Prochlorococcus marinus (strain SARG / CCMP1375 / SS120) TaxID=167539 RepID=Q7VCD1_PROMA|nr:MULTISPECIES: hypothetical protein [Prochlorococcus]AAP99853.1 Predicted protein [Prochlorococcus marinus subsp. marinus str. CCMP1375]KGG11800.1 hypothetical protein EV04_0825 [Prochlorococcus marinus str. LG]KGG18786.1 hypothetical protein EV08_1272 [Prochlorococcus marinus str. SS2]KGG23676.1 hypothetical protein EV09_1301 [Prochlorococcus marinus str. SS35]KGG32088.1 hypothetical protein EV10_1202 [Prochlorococcus marinus str. SS51]